MEDGFQFGEPEEARKVQQDNKGNASTYVEWSTKSRAHCVDASMMRKREWVEKSREHYPLNTGKSFLSLSLNFGIVIGCIKTSQSSIYNE